MRKRFFLQTPIPEKCKQLSSKFRGLPILIHMHAITIPSLFATSLVKRTCTPMAV